MNYQETIDYLYNSLPMFHRIGEAALKPSLDNTIKLCALLGNPQHKFKSVHIAGTNGKGSSSHMLASVLQAAGYKTGLFTSPHLKSFTERIKVNGKDISAQRIVDFVKKHKQDFEEIKPSFFEMTVALTFDYFADEKVDIAVVEVGLGGRFDSTNIITPLLSLITNISFDHQKILGNTLPEIASEKAGIIKTNIPVVISECQDEVNHVFLKKAKQQSSLLIPASEIYHLKNDRLEQGKLVADVYKGNVLKYKDLVCGLAGKYQLKNIAGVLSSIDMLIKKGFNISEEHIRKGISSVVSLTGLKGRWQVLNEKPLTICDTVHNEGGIKQIVGQINSIRYKNLFFVLGVVNDKDITSILSFLPKNAYYFFCKPDITRGLDAYVLCSKAQEYSLKGEVISEVKKAVAAAKSKATSDDLIFIGGSTFVVAEIEEL
ncbi:MAG: bifunctional folylpolyglutamate synthase/dihydrofolate synthase [Cytophagaceae bacterium]|nr:bifunctional folylpolyglutamate synthase/dihydrofolate synthase [Cytophagaceae bacterium]